MDEKEAAKRRLRAAGLGAAIVLALGLVVMALAMEMSSTPRFCGSCHIMEPYYQSWVTSSHDEVRCVDCHIPPGVTAEFRKKYEALSMVIRYFTGTYSTNPWTEIEDASCLRCHERRLLVAQELYQGILFDHAPHLTQMRRGKKLRCTSCHSQIVQGSHIAVTGSTCILCHFKDEQLGQGTARCTLCHQVPREVVERGTLRFDHADVVRFAMDCTGCHGDSVRGDGDVPRERCLTCHNEPARLSELDNVDLLHREHVTEHKVECMNCHLEIQHGLLAEHDEAAPECNRCHEEGHSLQRQLYAGIGGRGVEPLPSDMYLAGIRCEGCHLELPLQGEEVRRANDIACMSCHGPEYRKLYARWKSVVSRREQVMEALVRQSEPLFRQAPSQPFQDAMHNYRMVTEGVGVHNVAYTFRLLDKAVDLLNEARRERGAGPLEKPWRTLPYETTCFTCHEGAENQRGQVFERSFDHAPHVAGAKIECQTCHFSHDERTGGRHLRIGAGDCSSCHHREEPTDCQTCHAKVLAGTVPSERGAFSHQLHVEDMGIDCTDCHQPTSGGGLERNLEVCSECH